MIGYTNLNVHRIKKKGVYQQNANLTLTLTHISRSDTNKGICMFPTFIPRVGYDIFKWSTASFSSMFSSRQVVLLREKNPASSTINSLVGEEETDPWLSTRALVQNETVSTRVVVSISYNSHNAMNINSEFLSFAVRSFFMSFSDKNWSFLFLYEWYRMSSCTTCLIRNSYIPMYLAINLRNFLGSCQSWPGSHQEIGSSFLIRMVRVRLPTCPTFVIINGHIKLFLNPLHYLQINLQILWNLRIDWSGVNAKQYSVPFPNF